MGNYDCVVIIGASDAGKSTLAQALGRATGWVVGDTSNYIQPWLEKLMSASFLLPISEFELSGWIKTAAPGSISAMKRVLGDALRDADPGYLVRKAFGDNAQIVVGLRAPCELDWLLRHVSRALVICVYRGAAPASVEADGLYAFRKLLDDDGRGKDVEVLVNEGTLEELERSAARLVDKWKIV